MVIWLHLWFGGTIDFHHHLRMSLASPTHFFSQHTNPEEILPLPPLKVTALKNVFFQKPKAPLSKAGCCFRLFIFWDIARMENTLIISFA
jgi:hypothetical protein